MIHINEVIVVEGKYDKERLRTVTDAPIVCTHGYELYRSKQLRQCIYHLAKKQGIIILTDSDRAGFRIRNYLKSCLDSSCQVKHAYIPSVPGKEKRKNRPGKDGLLGVEGMNEHILEEVLRQVTDVQVTEEGCNRLVTKADFVEDGLSGKKDSAARRKKLAILLKLPSQLSSNALLDMINQVYGWTAYQKAVEQLRG